MNDRYLYRAKLKNWRELPKEVWWVEGYYAFIDNHHYIYTGNPYYGGLYVVAERYEIDRDTLCPCTGIEDKNSKLIWENDIVIINGWIGKVMWSSYDTAYIVLPNDDIKNETYCLGYWVNEYNVEVIGNEIDNLELLEVGE